MMNNISDDWTDDMSVPLPKNVTVDEVTKFVIEESFSGKNGEEVINNLVSVYQISLADAELVFDRVLGGISRASTNNSLNRPDVQKDPFAYKSYKMAQKNREIMAFFYPNRVQNIEKRPWWKFWK